MRRRPLLVLPLAVLGTLPGAPLPAATTDEPVIAAAEPGPDHAELAQTVAKVEAALTKAHAAVAGLDRLIAAEQARIERLREAVRGARDEAQRQASEQMMLSAARLRDHLRGERANMTDLIARLEGQLQALRRPAAPDAEPPR